jgi:hypothetical protein
MPVARNEPLRVTLLRTGLIAVGIGAVLALASGQMARWPMAALLAFWPAFGGHWVEVWFLDWLSPRLSSGPGVRVVARLCVWFVCGLVLAAGMNLTAMALTGFRAAPFSIWSVWSAWGHWWISGLGFIGVELIAHLAMHLRGLPNFYNGRG